MDEKIVKSLLGLSTLQIFLLYGLFNILNDVRRSARTVQEYAAGIHADVRLIADELAKNSLVIKQK